MPNLPNPFSDFWDFVIGNTDDQNALGVWKYLFVALFLYWVSGSLGIGMGYHRLLTHRGYKCSKWLEYFLTTCGAQIGRAHV